MFRVLPITKEILKNPEIALSKFPNSISVHASAKLAKLLEKSSIANATTGTGKKKKVNVKKLVEIVVNPIVLGEDYVLVQLAEPGRGH